MVSRCEWFWPGETLCVPPDDRGLCYGDGVFETLRVTARGPVLLDEHRERLLLSCRLLEIPFGAGDFRYWAEQAEEKGLLEPQHGLDQVLKLTVTRGSGGRGYGRPDATTPRVLTARFPAPEIPSGLIKTQLCRYPVQVPRHRAGLKTLERLDQVMASRELREDVFEGLMPDLDGHIVEGTRTNLLLLLSERIVVTPPARALAVQGTMRDWLLRELPGKGYRVRESSVSLSMLQRSQGVAVMNSVVGLLPVGYLDGVPLNIGDTMDEIRAWSAQAIGLTP